MSRFSSWNQALGKWFKLGMKWTLLAYSVIVFGAILVCSIFQHNLDLLQHVPLLLFGGVFLALISGALLVPVGLVMEVTKRTAATVTKAKEK